MHGNKHPLFSKALSRLPLGAIKPAGWLLNQLIQQKNGLTGRLDEIWPDVGPDSGWLGGTGERWERGPYYCDGLLPLAYLLDEASLIEKAGQWVEWSIRSQNAEGFFGPPDNCDWWPRFVMMKVLIQYYEATGDKRVIPMLLKYFRHRLDACDKNRLSDWGKARASDEIASILWLYNQTEEPFLLELAEKILEQGTNWTSIFSRFPFTDRTDAYMDWKKVEEKKYTLKERQELPYFETHVVNVAMGLKHPAIMQQLRGGDCGGVLKDGIKALKNHHGVVNGMFTGDEHLNGRSPSQGTELCAVVEYMYSLEQDIETFGGNDLCDELEKAAFNALPATITPDFCAHQYVQQVNQVLCTSEPRDWYNNGKDANIFGLEPNFGCCTANMHQGWPKYTQCLWMEKEEGNDRGVAAVSYAPCHVSWDGLVFDIDTGYPFKDIVLINIRENIDARVLWLRIPGWCRSPAIIINETAVSPKYDKDGYVKVNGLNSGDSVKLMLAPEIRTSHWHNHSLAVERGALLFALKIPSHQVIKTERGKFSDREIYPDCPWNYALNVKTIAHAPVTEAEIPEIPFDHKRPPVTLAAGARRVSAWGMSGNSAADVPVSPVISELPEEEVLLVPYGCTALRIAQFPFYIEKEER